ncbi:MAG TPA: MBL fold metallo-hydrolase [Methylomirabilota bacterium]|nr:MBL fold metallo-hydrolase [Methylomirabilota bacterium]
MLVRFWGTRGSIPVAMTSAEVKRKLVTALVAAAGRGLDTAGKARAFVEQELDFATSHTFGGNSSCVQIEAGGDDYVLCDLGSGARVFGNAVLATRGPSGHRFHVFMSHLHWDHIMGFPFFMPAYLPGNHVRIYGCHDALEEAFRRQNAAPSFPVDFSRMNARIEFVRLDPDRDHEVAGIRVRAKKQHHGGDSYGYRIEKQGKVVVYSTDSEHKQDDAAEMKAFVEFFRDADLVIFDAQYSLADAISIKEDWGHSSNVVGVEMCQLARARRLCLYHHEPIFDDERIATLLAETRRLEEITRGDHRVEVLAAYDGLEITL